MGKSRNYLKAYYSYSSSPSNFYFRFMAIMYDRNESLIPGNALVVDPTKQFKYLSKFGNAFLNK